MVGTDGGVIQPLLGVWLHHNAVVFDTAEDALGFNRVMVSDHGMAL